MLKLILESCPSMADMSWDTCFVSYRDVWIVAGSLSGAILLVLLICCWYCCYCRKSGGTSVVSGDWLKWEKKRQVSQAKNDERRQERQSRMDEIRHPSLKKLVLAFENMKRKAVPLNVVKNLLTTSTPEVAEDIIAQGLSAEGYQGDRKSSTCSIS